MSKAKFAWIGTAGVATTILFYYSLSYFASESEGIAKQENKPAAIRQAAGNGAIGRQDGCGNSTLFSPFAGKDVNCVSDAHRPVRPEDSSPASSAGVPVSGGEAAALAAQLKLKQKTLCQDSVQAADPQLNCGKADADAAQLIRQLTVLAQKGDRQAYKELSIIVHRASWTGTPTSDYLQEIRHAGATLQRISADEGNNANADKRTPFAGNLRSMQVKAKSQSAEPE